MSHEDKLSEPFRIRIGARQVCLLPPIIFLMVLDRAMRKVATIPRGLRCRFIDRLGTLIFPMSCELPHRSRNMQDKLKNLDNEGKKECLKINWGKTKEMRIIVRGNQQLQAKRQSHRESSGMCVP